ncbi:MAG: S-layer homology domain-containing protein [Patescibacteria group bacterium]
MSNKYTSKRVYISSLIVVIGVFYSLQPVFALKMMYESSIDDLASKIELSGGDDGGQFGAAYTVGDFNNDGRDDLVISSPYASADGNQWSGQIDIILSTPEMGEKKMISITGDDDGDQLGTSLASGDFNGDGITDIAVSAHNATFDEKRSGKVYVINGAEDLYSQTYRQMTSQRGRRIGSMASGRLNGVTTGDGFGMSIGAYDINQDGLDDLIVGAPLVSVEDSKVGAAYTYYGDSSGFLAGRVFYGRTEDGRFGAQVGAGKITSTGSVDILVGAYREDQDGLDQVGKIYLYKNATKGEPTITPDLVFEGKSENDWFGFYFTVGDVNQDGFDDLVASSFPYINPKYSGKVSVFYGGKRMKSDKPNVTIRKDSGEARLGLSISVQDINADGRSDLLIGAPGISTGKSLEAGYVYGIYNKPDGFLPEYSIDANDMNLVIRGESSDDWFGSSIGMLDFNEDGLEDLFVGGRYADNPNSPNSGKGYVIVGSGGDFGQAHLVSEIGTDGVSRGELLKVVFESFDLKQKKADYIRDCYKYSEFCLFNFLAMSTFDGIQLNPEIVLYPDVSPESPYYEEINLATMMGFVNGYTYFKDSPFHPEAKITRIQALKVILSATELVEPKYKAELKDIENTYLKDVNNRNESTWWYSRYLNFALKSKIIDYSNSFRPDENITPEELNDMIDRTLKHLNPIDEKVEP